VAAGAGRRLPWSTRASDTNNINIIIYNAYPENNRESEYRIFKSGFQIFRLPDFLIRNRSDTRFLSGTEHWIFNKVGIPDIWFFNIHLILFDFLIFNESDIRIQDYGILNYPYTGFFFIKSGSRIPIFISKIIYWRYFIDFSHKIGNFHQKLEEWLDEDAHLLAGQGCARPGQARRLVRLALLKRNKLFFY
jgi:hypothetical protein